MKFTSIRDLKYINADKSRIDLYVTCKEYGEIPMTLNIIDTEGIHTFVEPDGSEVPLEEYCRTQSIIPFDTEAYNKQKEQDRINAINSKAKSIILEKYPLEKQSSAQLGLYGEVYLQEMKDYITNIIRISNEAELNGIALEDIKWVNNV